MSLPILFSELSVTALISMWGCDRGFSNSWVAASLTAYVNVVDIVDFGLVVGGLELYVRPGLPRLVGRSEVGFRSEGQSDGSRDRVQAYGTVLGSVPTRSGGREMKA